MLDDGSKRHGAGPLYAQLITRGKGRPPDRALWLRRDAGRRAESERARRVLVNGAGPRRGARARAALPVPDRNPVLGVRRPRCRRLPSRAAAASSSLARDEPASREVAEALRDAAARRILTVNDDRGLPAAASPTSPFRSRRRAPRRRSLDRLRRRARRRRDGADLPQAWLRAAAFLRAAARRIPRFIALSGRTPSCSLGAVNTTRASARPERSFAEAFVAKWSLRRRACRGPGLCRRHGARGRRCAPPARLTRRSCATRSPSWRPMTVLGDYKVAPRKRRADRREAAGGRRSDAARWPRPRRQRAVPPYPQWDERRSQVMSPWR